MRVRVIQGRGMNDNTAQVSPGLPAPAPKWFEQTWFLVVSLLFCFPVGLFVVWRKSWSRNIKVLVTVVVLVLGIAVGAASGSSSSPKKATTTATVVTTTTRAATTTTTRALTTTTKKPVLTTTTRAATTTTAKPAPTTTTMKVLAPTVTQPPATPAPTNCTPGYDPCIPPGPDVDCAGGSGNGPRYVQGPVRVTGPDTYGLDRDGNGIGCE
jgi:hypothetical protein